MKTSICILIGSLLLTTPLRVAHAQASYGTEAYAAQQQQEERWRKLRADMDDALTTQEVLRKRIQSLEEENRSLRNELTRQSSSGVSPEEFNRVIKELSQRLKEVDDKRVSDNKTVIEQVQKLVRELKPGTVTPSPTKPIAQPPVSDEGYTHIVQDGETLSAIVKAFRAQGVNTSVSAIQAANPGLNSSKLKVGKEIFIPKPK